MYPGRSGLESPSMADDGGVLGNLPSSRPGRRSAKRSTGGTPAKSAGEAAERAEVAGKAAARPTRTPKAARTSPKPGRKAAGAASPGGQAGGPARARQPAGATAPDPRSSRPIEAEASSEPLAVAVRTAAGLAFTGVRVAGALTQELLRRLPRP
jgi:hypothetical protein